MEIIISDVDKVEEPINNGKSLKTTRRRLVIGRHQLFTLEHTNGNVTNNI